MKKIINKPEEVEQYWQLPPDEIRVNQRNSVQVHKKPPKESNVQIGLIQRQSLVGEYEILHNLKKRQFTLMCYSQVGQLFIFNRKDFEEFMLSEEYDREYLLRRASKISKMEQEILQKNQNGTLYNHFFSFENAYKNNRIQSKSNVLDESPLPYSNKGFSSPRLKLKASLAAEPISSLPSFQLTKQQSTGHLQIPISPSKNYMYSSYFPSDSENLSPADDILLKSSLKEKKYITLENIKMTIPSYLSKDSLNSPQSLNTPSPQKRKLKLDLKIKTEQNLDDQSTLKKKQSQQLNEIHLKNQNYNLSIPYSQNKLDFGPYSESKSISPQKISSYYHSRFFQEQSQKLNTNSSQGDDMLNQEENRKAQTFDHLSPDIFTFSKLGTLHDELQTQGQISTNKGLSSSTFPVTSDFMTNDQEKILIRNKKKSQTQLGQKQLQFLLQMQDAESKGTAKSSSFSQFDRQSKRPKTQSKNEHVDPFVKMFHKRLKYNFFQQYGKVDLQNLKTHVINDATKQLPDIDHDIPSLTDIRLLMEEYLNYKNEQEIKKINQKYIQQQSDINKISSSSSSQSHRHYINIENKGNHDITNQKQAIYPKRSSKDLSSLFSQFTQQHNQSEDNPANKVSQRDLKLIQDQYYNIEQIKQENKLTNSKKISQSSYSISNNLESKSKLNPQEDAQQQISTTRSIQKPLKNQNKSVESKPKQIDFQKKLDYLRNITSDHKLDRQSNKQYLTLGQTTSFNIKSLNKLPSSDYLNSQSDVRLGLFTARPSLQIQIKSFNNLSSLNKNNSESQKNQNLKSELINSLSKNEENKKQFQGQLSARQIHLNTQKNNQNSILMLQGFQSNQIAEHSNLIQFHNQHEQFKNLEEKKKKKQRIIVV